MKVFDIFKTIQGEGLFSGCPTTFIRFAGCSLACKGCDTTPSWKAENKLLVQGKQVDRVSVQAIVDSVIAIDPFPKHICITGGEPLEQRNEKLAQLVLELLREFYLKTDVKIVIETGGHCSLSKFIDLVGRIHYLPMEKFFDPVRFSVDFKTPSTGRHERMLWSNYTGLRRTDLIKFVCSDLDDFQWSLATLKKLQLSGIRTNVLFHSMGGQPDKWLAQEILETDWEWAAPFFDVRYGVQIHKLLGVA